MDVLCHALEAYVSKAASDFSDAMAEKAVKLVFGHLIDCHHQGDNLPAREKKCITHLVLQGWHLLMLRWVLLTVLPTH